MVLVRWLVASVVANGLTGTTGEAFRQGFTLMGFESTAAFELLEADFDLGEATDVGVSASCSNPTAS